ncbi:hypothetical protein [Frankia sp. CiP1_Cm_nod2]|uniref:hypothetical protein n=1 Tax=Frankia sp. CiP1_Cm_nod2 TaxID=2897161 RepID=UPI0020257591
MATQKRTSSRWLRQAHEELVGQAQGLTAPVTTALLDHLINRPGAAGRVRVAGGGYRVWQSVLASASDITLFVELGATVTAGLPPEVAELTVDAVPIEVGDDGRLSAQDLCVVAARLEAMYMDLGLRDRRERIDGPQEVLLLGTPTSGYRAVPADWEPRIRVTAAVVGLRLLVAATPGEVRSQSLVNRADLGVVVTGRADWPPIVQQMQDAGCPVERFGVPGEKFDSFHDAVRRHLVTVMWDAASATLKELPRIEAGHTVYHRKVASTRKFDHFDEGSPSPCKHGATMFVPWSGDKALKGMQRRYANFQPAMLLHCKHYPNCGVYAVRGIDRRAPCRIGERP